MYELDKRDKTLIGLVALFTASIVTAQLTASKFVGVELPIMGQVAFPAAVFAYSVTFFVTDVTSEMYGRETARVVVWAGFMINFVMLALVAVSIWAPNAGTAVPQEPFAMVLGSSAPVVLASLTAYIISQNWDVFIFHKIRDSTGTSHLWVRNIISTSTSQMIDSVVFLLVAFKIVPMVTGFGSMMPNSIMFSTIASYFVVKVFIALGDTPFVYAAVYLLEEAGFDRADLTTEADAQPMAD